MKGTILAAAFILVLFSVGTNAQTVKTQDGYRLNDVEKQIKETRNNISETNKNLNNLLKEYSEGAPEIKATQTKISELNKSLTDLIKERDDLLKKVLSKPIPNNDTELLKLIAQQNERIIELLERLVNKN